MFNAYTYAFIMILISIILYMINFLMSMIKPINFSKLTPYECGFSYITNPNLPFSLPFYLINLMFLIFDIEVIMLLPIIFYLDYLPSTNYLSVIFSFLFMLIFTMMYELIYNFLEWSI